MNETAAYITQLKHLIEKQKKEIESHKITVEAFKKDIILLQNQLKESISLQKIIALMPGNIYWKDKEGKYLGTNDNNAKVCNLTPQQMIGKRDKDIHPPHISDKLEKVDNAVIASGIANFCEEEGSTVNGRTQTFLTQKIPFHDDEGNIDGLLGISMDITERKEIENELKIAKEKAEASDRAKSLFLAVINHELRTPLASITGLINFLKRKNITKEEEEKLIYGIDSCAKHLLNLIDDVLDFSRLEADQYHLKLTAISLDNLLHEVFTILNPLAESKRLTLSFDNLSPINIITDARILRQILINLITNAIKFTEAGYVKVKVITPSDYETILPLKIVIEDSGIGIPDDKLDAIFEPFQQLEDAYTRQSSRSGTGLGLAIVKKLASLIQATISVDSKVNHGSQFTFSSEFKIAKIADDDLAKPSLSVEKTKPKLTAKMLYPHYLTYQPHILLIEDDPIVQYIHEKLLLDLGCKVDVITHGLEAIKILDKHHLVLTDISLPDISGFEVIKTIRKQHTSQQLPIIALTVYNGKAERMACLNAGANAFKNKPISPGSLRKLLLKYLSQQLVN